MLVVSRLLLKYHDDSRGVNDHRLSRKTVVVVSDNLLIGSLIQPPKCGDSGLNARHLLPSDVPTCLPESRRDHHPVKNRYAARISANTSADVATSRQSQLLRVVTLSSVVIVP